MPRRADMPQRADMPRRADMPHLPLLLNVNGMTALILGYKKYIKQRQPFLVSPHQHRQHVFGMGAICGYK